MHNVRKGVLCLVMVSLFSVNAQSQGSAATASQPTQGVATVQSGKLVRAGLGIQCGVRFHGPDAFNDFVTDVWNAYLEENIYTPADDKSIGPGVFLGLYGSIDIGPVFSVSPVVQGMWAGKQFLVRGGRVGDVHINTYTAMGGLNLWARAVTTGIFSLRAGAGVYATHTIATITGDITHDRLSGTGVGFRGLLGTEFRVSDNMMVTFDCGVPFGKSEFNEGDISVCGRDVDYPEEFEHLGFELSPGIRIYF